MHTRLKLFFGVALFATTSTQATSQALLAAPIPTLVVSARAAEDSDAIKHNARELTVVLRAADDTTHVVGPSTVVVRGPADPNHAPLEAITSAQGIARVDSIPDTTMQLEIRSIGYVGVKIDVRLPVRCHSIVEAFLEPMPLIGPGPTPI